MAHMRHSVNNGITHINIRRSHIDTGAEYLFPVGISALLHLPEKPKILLHGTGAVRILLTGFRQGSAVFPDLLRRQI